jgi:predicted nuclease of predicted toxin-antitoxin system
MKLLLDENLPHQLRPLLIGHNVFTVAFMKWTGVQNGELLARAAANGFDALLTKDLGIPYEQNQTVIPCAIVILEANSNSIRDVRPLVPSLLSTLASLKPRTIVRVR